MTRARCARPHDIADAAFRRAALDVPCGARHDRWSAWGIRNADGAYCETAVHRTKREALAAFAARVWIIEGLPQRED